MHWTGSAHKSTYRNIVKIGRTFSVAELLRYMVPQGCVLRTLLFLIYILSLDALLRKHHIDLHEYTDDAQIYIELGPKTQEKADAEV